MKLKDNKIYRSIIIPICIAMCMLGRFIPPINGLTSDAMGVIFIFLGSLILWLTIGIDWPSLLCIFSLGFLENFSFSKVFSSSFGNSTFIFLLFTFVCTYALSKTSLIKRVAIFFINLKLAKKSDYWFTFLFLFSVLLLGLFISPSVLFVIILPILNEIFELANIQKDDRIAKALMMGLAFTVSISSGMTPIAHLFPILAMNAANITVSPIAYMGMAIPVGLITFLLMILMFRISVKIPENKLNKVDVSILKKQLTKVDSKDVLTLAIFGFVILLWIIPSLLKNISPEFYNTINQYGTAMPPLLGTLLLCIIRVKGEPLCKIDEAFKKGVPWGSLIMCAATLVLGSALTNDAVGIKSFLQTSLSPHLKSLPALCLLIIFVVWAAIQTNLSSNMVTATLVATIAASIITSTTMSLNLNATICLIGMMASFAFATPPSMPHIAIAAGSDYCSTKDVLIYGSALMLISIIVAVFIGYPIGSALL